jgi:hypothetical protein
MLRIIVRGGGSLVASLILSALFAGVALGGEPSEIVADADLDLTVEILGDDDLLDVDADLAIDAVVDLGHGDEPLVQLDSDTAVGVVLDLWHHGDQPLADADLDTVTVAVVDLGGGHDGSDAVAWLGAGSPLVAEGTAAELLNVEGEPALDLAILIDRVAGPFDGSGAGSHTQVPIDLEVADEHHDLVHALVGASSETEAFVGDELLAAIGADACIEAIVGPGALVGCGSPETTVPGDGEDGNGPGNGDPIGPGDDSGEAPGAGSVPDASPGGPGGATGELPDTAVSPVTGGWLGIIGALLAMLAGAWSARRRSIGG